MQQLDCVYLTPSRVREYHECPACFFERYIGVLDKATGKRVKMKPTWDNTHISLLMGHAVHAGAEFGRTRMMEGRKFSMGEILNAALEAYNKEIGEMKGAAVFENSNIASLEEGAKEVAGLTRALATKLLPTEMGDKRIVAIERKLNYVGVFGFQFYARIDAQCADGTIKDLKTSSKDLDFWMRFQLLCYGLPDYMANPQNHKLDPIQVDQLMKDGDYKIFTHPFQPMAEDYEEVKKIVIQTFDAIQLLKLYNPRPGYKCKFEHPTLGHEGMELPAVRNFEFLMSERARKAEVAATGAITTPLDLSDLEAIGDLAEEEPVVEEEVSLV